MAADVLTDSHEVLFRQINPSFYQQGVVSSQVFEPTSQAFAPTAKDDGKLSVDRGALTTPQGSFLRFVGQGFRSVAVYGVSVGEFRGEHIICRSDPIAGEGGAANPAHALADYGSVGGGSVKTIAKRIKQCAVARGKLHPLP